MASSGAKRIAFVLLGFTILGACEDGEGFNPFEKKDEAGAEISTATVAQGATVIERDVESPEVFQKTENGLWDGRPSLGGVWVAHPDVVDPERVIIRNQANGKFVIGALFRRERETPGPRFQVSSDAATALSMLAGSPNELNVTALRREEVPVLPEVSAPAVDTLAPPDDIQETPLDAPATATNAPATTPAATPTPQSTDPVAAIAASAIEKATAESKPAAEPKAKPAIATQTEPVVGAPLQAPTKKVSSLEKPYIQIGIFSVAGNADRTADLLREAGVIPMLKQSSANGKDYWRVIVGPATTKSDRTAILKKVQGLGFSDAYAVTN